jgi:hypothetical protein
VGDDLVCGLRLEAEREGELGFVLYFGATVGTPIRMLFQSLFENFLARRELTVRRYDVVRCAKGHQLNRAVVREQLAEGENSAFCTRCGQQVALPPSDTRSSSPGSRPTTLLTSGGQPTSGLASSRRCSG